MERIYCFLKENISDEVIVVGVSGGVDSMVLLSILKEQLSCKIVCAHVHHNLREESDEELEFVHDYCKNNDIIFEFERLKYDGKFSEEIARTKRYNFFERMLKKYKSSTLFTAHHGDDLIETVMMKIVRGSTIKGYSGIESISYRNDYRILRPLLYLSKGDIYNYALKHNIPYREDYTNKLDDYTRNRYRNHLLPFLKSENSDVHLKFLEYSQMLLEYHNYVEDIALAAYDEMVLNNKVNLLKFNKLDDFIKKAVLKKYLFNNYADEVKKLSNSHLIIILNFIKNGVTNSYIDLPSGFRLVKEYEIFMLKKETESIEYYYEIKDKILLPNGRTIEIIEESADNSNYTTHLDIAGLKLPLYVRNYRKNDKMAIKNMVGRKKVCDIFTNEKVNIDDRKIWPVVVDSDDKIIWLPGLKKTNFDRKNTEKYDIILKYY